MDFKEVHKIFDVTVEKESLQYIEGRIAEDLNLRTCFFLQGLADEIVQYTNSAL